MVVVPLLAAVAFLGPPASVVAVRPGAVLHLVRPAHTAPQLAAPATRAWRARTAGSGALALRVMTLRPWWAVAQQSRRPAGDPRVS